MSHKEATMPRFTVRSALLLSAMAWAMAAPSRAVEVVRCLPSYAKPSASCVATGHVASGNWTLRSNVLVGDRLYVGGTVAVERTGKIGHVGCADGDSAEPAMLDCPGTITMAGLINLHEHLNYSTGHPLPPPAHPLASHRDWQRDPRLWPGQKVRRTGRRQPIGLVELRHLLSGTTTLAGRGQAKGLTRNPDAGWFPKVRNITFPFGRSALGAPVDCRSRRLVKVDRPTLVHAGEGVDAAARAELDCLLDNRAAYAQTEPLTLVHAIGVDDAMAARMAALHVSMLWSPRSNIELYGTTASVDVLMRNGVSVSLGTDWLPSGSPTLLAEARYARTVTPAGTGLSDQTLLDMMTVHPAAAIGMQGQLGVLQSGALADIVGLRLHGDVADATRDILAAQGQDTVFVLVGGRFKFAAQDVAGALGTFVEANDCVELPPGQCTPEGYVCGPRFLRHALARPDAQALLCPASPTGTWN